MNPAVVIFHDPSAVVLSHFTAYGAIAPSDFVWLAIGALAIVCGLIMRHWLSKEVKRV